MAAKFMPPTPPSTPPRKAKLWDPVSVLQILNADYGNTFTCLGYAKTQGRRCRLPPASGGKPEVYEILGNLTYSTPNFKQMEDELEEAARAGLCGRWHQWKDTEEQVSYVLQNWKKCIMQISNHAPNPKTMRSSQMKGGAETQISIKEEGQGKSPVESMRSVELENITLRTTIHDLEKEKNRIADILDQVSQAKAQLGRQAEELKQNAERQRHVLESQLRNEKESAAEHERTIQNASKKLQKENNEYRQQLKKEEESRQKLQEILTQKQAQYQTIREERKEIQRRMRKEEENTQEFQRTLTQQQTQYHILQEEKAEAQKRFERAEEDKQELQRAVTHQQTQYQTVQDEKNNLQNRVEMERENNQKLQRSLTYHQNLQGALREDLQCEKVAFTRLMELHEREQEDARRERAAFRKLVDDHEQEQQQYRRLQSAFRVLQEDYCHMVEDRDRARRELRRAYQDSATDRASLETGANPARRRLQRLFSRQRQGQAIKPSLFL